MNKLNLNHTEMQILKNSEKTSAVLQLHISAHNGIYTLRIDT